jgi:hypothetical protein
VINKHSDILAAGPPRCHSVFTVGLPYRYHPRMVQDLVAVAATDPDALEELTRIAAARPLALTPYLRELLERDVLWPPAVFRGADSGILDELIRRADTGELTGLQLNHVLLILANTRDSTAEAALRRWDAAPPAAMGTLPLGVAGYARQGGWILAPDRVARDLHAPVAYELTMRPVPNVPDAGTCPWCESPLWTVFDLDTSQQEVGEALAHTGWAGRLRIITCFLCVNYTTLYSVVTPDGGSSWSPLNQQPDYLRSSTEEPPRLLSAVGARRATPFLANAWEEGGSTLGGWPDWIQDGDYVDCAGCGQPMDYVGLVGGADLGWGEGADYLFLHAPCGLAAVCYQQS